MVLQCKYNKIARTRVKTDARIRYCTKYVHLSNFETSLNKQMGLYDPWEQYYRPISWLYVRAVPPFQRLAHYLLFQKVKHVHILIFVCYSLNASIMTVGLP